MSNVCPEPSSRSYMYISNPTCTCKNRVPTLHRCKPCMGPAYLRSPSLELYSVSPSVTCGGSQVPQLPLRFPRCHIQRIDIRSISSLLTAPSALPYHTCTLPSRSTTCKLGLATIAHPCWPNPPFNARRAVCVLVHVCTLGIDCHTAPRAFSVLRNIYQFTFFLILLYPHY